MATFGSIIWGREFACHSADRVMLVHQGGLSLVAPADRSNFNPDTVQRAMRAMVKHFVPAHPENYHVWFNHLAGADPDLSMAIESHAKRGAKFDEEKCAELFRTFVLAKYASNQLKSVHEDMQSILRDALSSMGAAGAATSEFGDLLEGSASSLDSAQDLSAVRAIVTALAAKTVDMAGVARNVQDELRNATEHVQHLQERLEATKEAALIDPLTGLHNRAGFDRRIAVMETEFRAERVPFSVVVADIDHFKKFNDTYGHQVGDAVLRLVGKVLKDLLKGKDCVARYGGEEFVALLPQTSRDAAGKVAQQIRKSIETQRLRVRSTDQEIPKITMSFGVAEFAQRDTRDSVVDRADQALYLAKRSGRNQVKTEIELAKSA